MKRLIQFVQSNGVLLALFYMILMFVLSSCENTYKANKNYKYTFSGTTYQDNIGRSVYGSHHFILDEAIKDKASFKECYVDYLKWSGLDTEGLYKKAYYRDPKNIKIELLKEVWGDITVTDADLCN